MEKCDLIIAVVTRFADRVTDKGSGVWQNARLLHIDTDMAEIGKNRLRAEPAACGLLLLGEELVQLMNQLVAVGAVGHAGLLDGLGHSVGAAQAVHAELHEDAGGVAVSVQHLSQSHVLFNRHGINHPFTHGVWS